MTAATDMSQIAKTEHTLANADNRAPTIRSAMFIEISDYGISAVETATSGENRSLNFAEMAQSSRDLVSYR